MKMQPLTDEERRFAEEHHGLVYGFLRRNQLSIDKYYDVAVFGYLKAVQSYFKDVDNKGYAFSTTAFYWMRSAVSNEDSFQSRRIKAVSLDSLIPGCNGLRFGHVVEDDRDMVADVEAVDAVNQILAILPKQQRRIVRRKLQLDTFPEIAESEGITFNAAAWRYYSAIKQIKASIEAHHGGEEREEVQEAV